MILCIEVIMLEKDYGYDLAMWRYLKIVSCHHLQI
jgi:hypothetical protein